jgi:hypothetical protein
MLCECKLPHRAEPVNEVDCFTLATFLSLVAACSVFFVYNGNSAEIWLPLLFLAFLFSSMARHYHFKRRGSTPLQNNDLPSL